MSSIGPVKTFQFYTLRMVSVSNCVIVGTYRKGKVSSIFKNNQEPL